jgi:FMN hydrolase / 5-amino-6-(5-phospho-D-ribitylamino)uracil phosphatase
MAHPTSRPAPEAALRRVRAISFDGDGTLWDFESSMRTALAGSAAALAEAGLRRDGERVTPEWLAAVREEVAADPLLAGAGVEAIRLAAFEEATWRCEPARADLAPALFERYVADRFAALRPFPDAAAAVADLSARLPLALVTNGNTHPRRVGMGAQFAEVLIAFECGLAKPDPAIYALAARRLGVEPGACLHVGDHPREDVEAARLAGMRCVWVNRSGAEWPDTLPAPEAELEDLAALPALLAG